MYWLTIFINESPTSDEKFDIFSTTISTDFSNFPICDVELFLAYLAFLA